MATKQSCCPDQGIDAPIDFSVYSGSPLGYMQRIGLWLAHPSPQPLSQPDMLRPHTIPLVPPLPLAPLQTVLNGAPPPDRGQTFSWPHPEFPEGIAEETG